MAQVIVATIKDILLVLLWTVIVFNAGMKTKEKEIIKEIEKKMNNEFKAELINPDDESED